MRNALRAVGLLAVLAGVALAACGGGDEGELSPTAAPASPTVTATPEGLTAEERSAAEALLKAITLGAKDLPEGFTIVDEWFTTNEEAAEEEGSSPGALTVEDFDRLGRILGYETVYSREASSGTLLVIMTTVVYRDPTGAGEHFDLLRQQPSDTELLKALQESSPDSNLDIQNATVSPISFAEVGNDRFAYELKMTVHVPDLNTNVEQFARFVNIRRGRGIGSFAVVAIGAPHPLEEVEAMARKLDDRMKDALE